MGWSLAKTPWQRIAFVGAAVLAAAILIVWFYPFAGPLRNEPMKARNERDQLGAVDPQRPVVVISFSGGGVRAAALGYFVLQLLKDAQYTVGGTTHRLIDDVRVVSSVSGGSVVAAYFALFGADRLDEFRKEFIVRDNLSRIFRHALIPTQLARLAFSGYSRSDAFADWLDAVLFEGARYRDLRAIGKPMLVVNATDMSAGTSFAFTYDNFNDICSDLASFPVARAVAASAAFPVFMAPVTLTNHAGSSCPGGIDDEPFEPEGLSLEVLRMQTYSGELRRARNTTRDVRYVHLVDGALSDNLGVRALLRLLKYPSPIRIDLGSFSKLIVISVNARAGGTPELDENGSTPSILDVLNAVASVPMGSSSDNSLSELESFVPTIYPEDKPWVPHKRAKFIKVDLADSAGFCTREFTRRLNSIPTSWTISEEDLLYLEAAARVLLSQEPGFIQLDQELKGQLLPEGKALLTSMLFCQQNKRPH